MLYFLYKHDNPVKDLTTAKHIFLPISRKGQTCSVSASDYFEAAATFLRLYPFNPIELGTLDNDDNVHIILEKHGEFYHPAKIVINGRNMFVLNIAVSDAGRRLIDKEYHLLKHFAGDTFIPNVYKLGTIQTKSGINMRMFLGDWFDGFYEFHISQRSDGKEKIAVWDTENGIFFLSPAQTLELYRLSAMILTRFYQVETFEQIQLWHHGSGDFVVKVENNALEIRLITMRKYAPLVQSSDGNRDLSVILEALLRFFLNLSLRMRIDRADGVGDILWAAEIAVFGTLKGFFQALTDKSKTYHQHNPGHAPLNICFLSYLLSFTKADLVERSNEIIDSWNPDASETSVARQHLNTHIEDIMKAVSFQWAAIIE